MGSPADSQPFDLGELSRRIEHQRDQQQLTMSALARHVGVSASTIRRFATADDAEADGALALIGWLGDAPEEFIADSTVAGAPLPPAGVGVIRVDMTLVAQATSTRTSATRTTIQRLASAAQTSGQTVASFTRWSAI